MIQQGLSTSVLGRAEERGFISPDIQNIRDYTTGRHGYMDDAPYSGGVGILMQVDPVLHCCRSATTDLPKAPWVAYATPQGRQFTQADAKMFAAEETLLTLCGHYEGIDERTLGLLGAESYSIGDYVLTGGELSIMVMVDAISRMVPGVLSNQEGGKIGSLESNLPGYPQCTRPEIYEGLRVPPVPLLGDRKKIAQWRREQALPQARKRHPDLFTKVELSKADRKFLQTQVKWSVDESWKIACEIGRFMLNW